MQFGGESSNIFVREFVTNAILRNLAGVQVLATAGEIKVGVETQACGKHGHQKLIRVNSA